MLGKITLASVILLMVGALGTTAMVQAQIYDPAQGNTDGKAAAQSDAANNVNMDASCQAHGINNVGNEQYCFNYKIGYLAEQAALALSK